MVPTGLSGLFYCVQTQPFLFRNTLFKSRYGFSRIVVFAVVLDSDFSGLGRSVENNFTIRIHLIQASNDFGTPVVQAHSVVSKQSVEQALAKGSFTFWTPPLSHIAVNALQSMACTTLKQDLSRSRNSVVEVIANQAQPERLQADQCF
ncbi:hypothetical protein BKM14_14750 [Pseudomonas syringae pv. syringae]|nr:hypothetical protein BKM14_14750 [Pseudomonas syringae pv. syringae]